MFLGFETYDPVKGQVQGEKYLSHEDTLAIRPSSRVKWPKDRYSPLWSEIQEGVTYGPDDIFDDLFNRRKPKCICDTI